MPSHDGRRSVGAALAADKVLPSRWRKVLPAVAWGWMARVGEASRRCCGNAAGAIDAAVRASQAALILMAGARCASPQAFRLPTFQHDDRPQTYARLLTEDHRCGYWLA